MNYVCIGKIRDAYFFIPISSKYELLGSLFPSGWNYIQTSEYGGGNVPTAIIEWWLFSGTMVELSAEEEAVVGTGKAIASPDKSPEIIT